jgi:hypothetical protein
MWMGASWPEGLGRPGGGRRVAAGAAGPAAMRQASMMARNGDVVPGREPACRRPAWSGGITQSLPDPGGWAEDCSIDCRVEA